MVDKLTEFLKNELVYFINQELNKGKSIESVRKALLKAGHHRDMIEEVIEILRRTEFDLKKALKEPISKSYLEERSYYDLLNAIIRYIEYQREHKVSFSKIKSILLDYGHSGEVIEEAFNEILMKQREKAKKKTVPLLLLSWLVIMFLITSSVKENIFLVILGLLPALISLIICSSIKTKKSMTLFIIPFVVIIVFFILGNIIPVYQNMEIGNLSILNLIIGLIYGYVLTYFMTFPKEKTKKEEKSEEKEFKIEPMLKPLK